MYRKKWLGLFAICIVFCMLPVGLLAIRFIQPYFVKSSVPLYTLQQSPSTYSGYTRTTVSSGNTTYESDYPEYALSVTGADSSQLIGETPLGGQIYEIPGEDPLVYVVLWDFMSPSGIYRNTQQPPFDWRTANFHEMQLYPMGTGPDKSTTNPQLIQDVIATLKSTTTPTSPSQATGSISGYSLYLYTDQLPGISYEAGVYVDSAGKVYLAENTISQQWFPANQNISNWVTSH